MGILTMVTESSSLNYDIPAAEGYHGEVGICQMAIESVQNEMAIFESIIRGDLYEAIRLHEGASEDELMDIHENAITNAFEKLKEFFKKLWAKIKGIFESAIAKFNSIFMKDNKEFYNKYKDRITKTSKSFSDFKAAYSKPKYDPSILVSAVNGKIAGYYIEYKSGENYKDLIEKWDKDNELTKCLSNKWFKASDSKSFASELHEYMFEDKDSSFDWSKSAVLEAIQPLATKSCIDALKKASDGLQNHCKKIISQVEKAQKNLGNAKATVSDKNPKTVSYDYSVATSFHGKGSGTEQDKEERTTGASQEDYNDIDNYLSWANKRAHVFEEAATKISHAVMAEAKFFYSQARRIMSSAISYVNIHGKEKNESFMEDPELYNAIGEAAEYEFNIDFDAAELV